MCFSNKVIMVVLLLGFSIVLATVARKVYQAPHACVHCCDDLEHNNDCVAEVLEKRHSGNAYEPHN
jgi:hypothetical protein